MDVDLDAGKLILFLGGLLAFLGIETLIPRRQWHGNRVWRPCFHVGIAILNTVMMRYLVYVPFLLWIVFVEENGWGISRWLGLVGWVELIASIIVLDFFDYIWHRLNHRSRFLWRFHKFHHTDTSLDVTTALRFHPGELLLSALAKTLWIALWGPTTIAWFIFEGLVSLCAQFHHSNFDFPDKIERWLSAIFVTPRYHAAHHAVDRQYGDANFSTIFSIWDPLFGSYMAPEAGGMNTSEPGSLGLPESRELAFQPVESILEPFRRRNLWLNSQQSIQKDRKK